MCSTRYTCIALSICSRIVSSHAVFVCTHTEKKMFVVDSTHKTKTACTLNYFSNDFHTHSWLLFAIVVVVDFFLFFVMRLDSIFCLRQEQWVWIGVSEWICKSYYWNKVVDFCFFVPQNYFESCAKLLRLSLLDRQWNFKKQNKKKQKKSSEGWKIVCITNTLRSICRCRQRSTIWWLANAVWNAQSKGIFCDLKTFIWSINSDIFHIVCISIRRIRFPPEFEFTHFSVCFDAYLKQWIRAIGHCVVVVAIAMPISTVCSYQLLSQRKLMNMLALESLERGQMRFEFFFFSVFSPRAHNLKLDGCLTFLACEFENKYRRIDRQNEFKFNFCGAKNSIGRQLPKCYVFICACTICAQRNCDRKKNNHFICLFGTGTIMKS